MPHNMRLLGIWRVIALPECGDRILERFNLNCDMSSEPDERHYQDAILQHTEKQRQKDVSWVDSHFIYEIYEN